MLAFFSSSPVSQNGLKKYECVLRFQNRFYAIEKVNCATALLCGFVQFSVAAKKKKDPECLSRSAEKKSFHTHAAHEHTSDFKAAISYTQTHTREVDNCEPHIYLFKFLGTNCMSMRYTNE